MHFCAKKMFWKKKLVIIKNHILLVKVSKKHFRLKQQIVFFFEFTCLRQIRKDMKCRKVKVHSFAYLEKLFKIVSQ